MERFHNKRIPVYLKRMMHKILFRDQKGKYVVNHATDESVKKYKTISIARGFSQIEGGVYDETLDPVNLIHFHLYYHP
jgi:hypothetical protein